MIATYALCGFSNLSTIGIAMGVLGGMAPSKRHILAKIAFRALISGCICCFYTAEVYYRISLNTVSSTSTLHKVKVRKNRTKL
ncbi:unnamed protein product [Heligmosomoides polygyrus]|uniref:Nucleos_tra2_C domain-containing protein n=1 Tax=Heligmosomoides polygyrus TaxID=6339 RepID=A0A183G2G3_HELPZ|nr:unnamed protein product [Heligmosomoides polygyrus]